MIQEAFHGGGGGSTLFFGGNVLWQRELQGLSPFASQGYFFEGLSLWLGVSPASKASELRATCRVRDSLLRLKSLSGQGR